MRLPLRVVDGLALLLVLGGWAPAPASAASLARKLDTIFAPTRVEQATMTRDGRHLALAVRDERDLQMHVYAIDGMERAARLSVGAQPGAGVQRLEWIAPDRLVVVIDGSALLVLDEQARVKLKLDDVKSWTTTREERSGRPVVRSLGRAPDGDAVLLEVRWLGPGGDLVLDVLRVDVRTWERRLLASRRVDPPGGHWLLDRQGRPRVLFVQDGAERRFRHVPGAEGGGPEQWLDRLVAPEARSSWQVTPRTLLGERAFPLEFDLDPQVLYFASNVGRDTFGLYALDLRTGRPTGFAIEDPGMDLADVIQPIGESGLVFDRSRQALVGVAGPAGAVATRWFDGELAEIQTVLDGKFPDRAVRVLEWDDARERFLVRVTAPTDAGRIFVFHRGDGRCVEYQRNPALAPDHANRVESFAWIRADGERITGTVTWPGASAPPAPPLVLWMHDGPVQQARAGFQREEQALAAAGFAVARINYRGTAGFGRRRYEVIREAFDRVPLADARTVVAELAANGRIDRARVAIAGEGFGGYLALRALQLHSDVFRAAVAINAPLELSQLHEYRRDPEAQRREAEQRFYAGNQALARSAAAGLPGSEGGGDGDSAGSAPAPAGPPGGGSPGVLWSFEREFARWFFGPADRQKIAVTSAMDQLTGPVMLLHDPQRANPEVGPVRRLQETLTRRKQEVEWVELNPAFVRGATEARVQVFRRISEFLALHLTEVAGGEPEVQRP